MRRGKQCSSWACAGLCALVLAFTGCESSDTKAPQAKTPPAKQPELGAPALKKPAVAIDLPEEYNTPDGMTVDRDKNIILSCPNSNDEKHPAKMLRISPNDEVSEIISLPVHPDTKKAGPLGVDIGQDGNLYIADNQSFTTPEHKSRLLRVVMENGKAQKCEVLVLGLIMANAIACHGGSVYVTESKLDTTTSPMPSGVYRFTYEELNPEKPIQLEPGGKDKHLILKIETKNMDWVGANGMAFDAKGNLFVCNFGDAKLHKFTFDKDGKIASGEVFAQGPGMKSCDGMCIDPRNGDIYVADFLGNAVQRIDPISGKVTTIAQNGDTDGADGSLDRPSEVRVRGNLLYVSNIDLPLAGNTYDKPHTISVIKLDE